MHTLKKYETATSKLNTTCAPKRRRGKSRVINVMFIRNLGSKYGQPIKVTSFSMT